MLTKIQHELSEHSVSLHKTGADHFLHSHFYFYCSFTELLRLKVLPSLGNGIGLPEQLKLYHFRLVKVCRPLDFSMEH